MATWTLQDIQQATGATVAKATRVEAERFSIDTRTLEAGDIYIALQGERLDGHTYVKEALDNGAVAAIVHHVVEGVPEEKQIVVEDTYDALCDLAAYHRSRLQATLVGVTGSVGKTGTKEALRVVLGTKGKTYASHGNFNNHIGTPLCLVNMPLDAAFGVFEMGMNHVGEISRLSTLVRPHLALITTVEAVHLEFFDSEEAIADAKAEIFDGMDANGIAALNSDNPHYLRLKRAAEKHGLGNIISFGVNEMAVCRLMEYRPSATGSEVVATISGTPIGYQLGTVGRHWALTSVAVLAAADALGCDLPKAAQAMANFREPKGRGRLVNMPWNDGAILFVDDSYNASPSSMMAAFDKMKELKTACPGRRTVAILGDMLELGDLSSRMHASLADSVVKAEIDVVHTAGALMRHLHTALPENRKGLHAQDAAVLLERVASELQAGDIVLVKGSHGSRMWKLAEELQNAAQSGNHGYSKHQGAVHAV